MPTTTAHLPGIVPIGHQGAANAFLYGAGLFVVLQAFASGGAAVTGVEAISNGVTAFKRPEWLNARKTLVIMGCTLGVLFLGLSALSTKTHPIPYSQRIPDGDLPGRQGRLRRRRRSARSSSTCCRPAPC